MFELEEKGKAQRSIFLDNKSSTKAEPSFHYETKM